MLLSEPLPLLAVAVDAWVAHAHLRGSKATATAESRGVAGEPDHPSDGRGDGTRMRRQVVRGPFLFWAVLSTCAEVWEFLRWFGFTRECGHASLDFERSSPS